MAKVRMPDGTVVAFPDDMPREQIRGLIAKKFPEAISAPQPRPVLPPLPEGFELERRGSGYRTSRGSVPPLPEGFEIAAPLAQFRAKYPQYDDLSDEQLADAIHRKFYSDMPREEFDDRIGLRMDESQQSRNLRKELSGITRGYDGDPQTPTSGQDGPWKKYTAEQTPGSDDLKEQARRELLRRRAAAELERRRAGAQSSESPGEGMGGQPAEQTYGGAATTWLEHAISDLPVVGPYIQAGSDYIGTEVIGRVSGQNPEQMREQLRMRRDARNQDYPLSSASGAIGGNAAAFGGAGATAAGARALGISGSKFLPRALSSARTGGAISASDSLARGGSADEAVGSGIGGAAIGAAIPALGQALKAGVSYVGGKVAPALGMLRNPTREAERRVGTAIRRDAAADPAGVMSEADELAAREAGIPLLNADRGGETTRALARSAANQSPEARGVIERTANDRFAGQSQRAIGFIRRLTGGAADDLALQDRIREAARAANRPAYNRAFRSPAATDMWDREFADLMEAPAVRKAVRGATTTGANKAVVEGAETVKNPFIEVKGKTYLSVGQDGSVARPNLRFWDAVKKNLDDQIGIAQRAGAKERAKDLIGLKGRLVEKLDAAVPEYKQARAGAAAFFGAEDAIEAGRNFANSPRTVPEARRAFGRFTPPERRAFATGYASELIDRIRASSDRQNVINQVFGSQASRESMELVFGRERMHQVEAYVRAETIADRLRGAMGGSNTTRQLVELGLGATGGAFVTGDWQGALLGAAAVRAPRQVAQWGNNRVMQSIARLLTSDDPAAMQRVVANASRNPKYMDRLEELGALIAGPARGAALHTEAQR